MAIQRVKLNDFLVFKGKFAADFVEDGVNVLIGENGTGKSTLLKCLYGLKWTHSRLYDKDNYALNDAKGYALYVNNPIAGIQSHEWGNATIGRALRNFVYIPEKDILEHANGLMTFIRTKQTGFSLIYEDVLLAAQDVPTKNQTENQKEMGKKIADIIGGHIEWVPSEGSFYTIRTDGTRIPFANEASGFRKFGFLGLLIACGQLGPDTVLFWDEPENSLNPELVPKLVDILLELSRNGVQIFIATHSELLASYFAVNRKKGDKVMFMSLYKDGEEIKANTGDRFDLLEPNNLTAEPVKLYEKEIERGLGGNE